MTETPIFLQTVADRWFWPLDDEVGPNTDEELRDRTPGRDA